jgi:glycosyltransferase involved in cell wall biosynthesis
VSLRGRRRIVFAVPYGYPALVGGGAEAAAFGYVGGAEIQQARLARVLAGRGHDVWMVSADFGQPRRTAVDGITVERAFRPFAGVPGLRFFHPRLSGLWSALSRVDADIVYQRSAGALTGQCALWARARGRRFVFASAHDFDPLPRSPGRSNPRDAWLYRFGLHRADAVLAQNAAQVEAFRRLHGIAATVVRNVIPLAPAPRAEGGADAVVWVGTIKPQKRPEWILAAAAALPHVRFVVAGGPPPPPADPAPYHAFRAAAAALPNVEALGFVAPADLAGVLARARLLAHTSPAEGFPNVLLEAWALGVPSVSVVDPDGAVGAAGAARAADDASAFTGVLAALWADDAGRRAMGDRVRAYVAARHSPEAVAGVFEGAAGLAPPASIANPSRGA